MTEVSQDRLQAAAKFALTEHGESFTGALIILVGSGRPQFVLCDRDGEHQTSPGQILQALHGLAVTGYELNRELALALQRLDELCAARLKDAAGL